MPNKNKRENFKNIFMSVIKSTNEQSFGVTLVDLLIIVAIIGAIAGIAVPVYFNQIDKARTTKAMADIRMLEGEIALYRRWREDAGMAPVLPASLGDIGRDNFLDPWDNPYQYASHELIPKGHRRKYHATVPLNEDYDLYSMGPDGKTSPPIRSRAGREDIVRADNGGYVGSGTEF
jgi:general secretion pathway protein G